MRYDLMRQGEWTTYAAAAQLTGERAEVWGNRREGFRLMFGGSRDNPNAFAPMGWAGPFRRVRDAKDHCRDKFGLKATRGRDW